MVRSGLVMYLFSPSQRQFYVRGIHSKIPADVVEASSAVHAEFMAAQARGEHHTIKGGKLVKIEPPAAAIDALAAAARRRRDGLLAAADWTQLPDAPLSKTAQRAWKAYRASLRDLPAQPRFPRAVEWPERPA